MYLYTKKDSDSTYFDKVYARVNSVNATKTDIIYTGFFPRLKETKYRGQQAFKQLVRSLDGEAHLTESGKAEWIAIFKLCYDCQVSGVIINEIKTLVFECDQLKVKKYMVIDDGMTMCEEMPTSQHLEPMSSQDHLDVVYNYIVAEELTETETFQLIRLLLT
tara:strand:+ start:694 stop:1179 length:486 start_codon:yes stop_codon:yes gene_type:complete